MNLSTAKKEMARSFKLGDDQARATYSIYAPQLNVSDRIKFDVWCSSKEKIQLLTKLGNGAIGVSVDVSPQYGGGPGKLVGWTEGPNPTVMVKIEGYRKSVPMEEITL